MATAGDVVEEDLGRMNPPFGRAHKRISPPSVVARTVSELPSLKSPSRPWVVDTRAKCGISTSRNLTVGPGGKARQSNAWPLSFDIASYLVGA